MRDRTAIRSYVFMTFIACVPIVAPAQTTLEDPVVRRIEARYDANGLTFDVYFQVTPDFDGAWDFQIFLDTGRRADTGYAHGYDLVVRGLSPLTQPVPVHSTVVGSGPGGWGTQVGAGSARMVDAQHLRLTLLYGNGGIASGDVRFTFETYMVGALVSSVRDHVSEPADGYVPQDCNGNGIPDDRDIATGQSEDCSGNGVPDECEPDCDNDGIPDVCAILADPTLDCDGDGVPAACESFARAEGSRYIAIRPYGGSIEVALLIRGSADDAGVACVEAYVQADGTLGSRARFALPEQWCKVHVHDERILPARSYEVYEDRGSVGRPQLSKGVTVTTWPSADTNQDYTVDFNDINRVVDGFLGRFSPDLTLRMVDVMPDTGTGCRPDGLVSFKDITTVVDTFVSKSTSTACPVPCQ